MESRIDYLTLTMKPVDNSVNLLDAFDELRNTMLLGDLFDKMILKGRAGFYDHLHTYENIFLLVSKPERFHEQGICIKFSSQGLDFFSRYLDTYKITLREWLAMWRGICFSGAFVTKFTRFDYAMDDIRYNGDKPALTLKRVIKAAFNGEICKKARVLDFFNGDEVRSRSRLKKVDGEQVLGQTLYIGVRDSDKLIRFYDKRAERLQSRAYLPENCTSWSRCELELKGSAAMAAVNAFIDKSEDDFAEYMRGVVNNQCRFIIKKNKNISRCPMKRWWKEFLCGCTDRFKLPHKTPARCSYARAERGLTQYVPTIYTMFQELGLEGVYRFFEAKVDEYKEKGKTIFKSDLSENIKDNVKDYEDMTAFTHYAYASDEDEFILTSRIKEQTFEYFLKKRQYMNNDDLQQQHNIFMNGQEVLLVGV